jgi:mitochondrial fission protein ELM1
MEETYKSISGIKPDVVVSCGSGLAAVNFVVSRENLARSVVVMRPSIFSVKRFDLVVMPRHDNPPERKNVAVTEGALNIIAEDYLAHCKSGLEPLVKLNKDLVIGLLIGGDTKSFRLRDGLMNEVVSQVKTALDKLDGQILVTTSRRTNARVESLLKEGFKDYSRCKFLVIANEKNLPGALGGILALSRIIIVSPESISMISEAASSGSYIIVFKSAVDRRHDYFLNNLARKKYIYLVEPGEICSLIEKLWKERPPVNMLKDNAIVEDALKRIL